MVTDGETNEIKRDEGESAGARARALLRELVRKFKLRIGRARVRGTCKIRPE